MEEMTCFKKLYWSSQKPVPVGSRTGRELQEELCPSCEKFLLALWMQCNLLKSRGYTGLCTKPVHCTLLPAAPGKAAELLAGTVQLCPHQGDITAATATPRRHRDEITSQEHPFSSAALLCWDQCHLLWAVHPLIFPKFSYPQQCIWD